MVLKQLPTHLFAQCHEISRFFWMASLKNMVFLLLHNRKIQENFFSISAPDLCSPNYFSEVFSPPVTALSECSWKNIYSGFQCVAEKKVHGLAILHSKIMIFWPFSDTILRAVRSGKYWKNKKISLLTNFETASFLSYSSFFEVRELN